MQFVQRMDKSINLYYIICTAMSTAISTMQSRIHITYRPECDDQLIAAYREYYIQTSRGGGFYRNIYNQHMWAIRTHTFPNTAQINNFACNRFNVSFSVQNCIQTNTILHYYMKNLLISSS